MGWSKDTIDVGTVLEGSTVRVVFKRDSKEPGVRKIEAGCTKCTNFKLIGKELHVQISLGQIPIHLRNQKTQEFAKTLTVVYDNGDRDTLLVTGKKQRK